MAVSLGYVHVSRYFGLVIGDLGKEKTKLNKNCSAAETI